MIRFADNTQKEAVRQRENRRRRALELLMKSADEAAVRPPAAKTARKDRSVIPAGITDRETR